CTKKYSRKARPKTRCNCSPDTPRGNGQSCGTEPVSLARSAGERKSASTHRPSALQFLMRYHPDRTEGPHSTRDPLSSSRLRMTWDLFCHRFRPGISQRGSTVPNLFVGCRIRIHHEIAEALKLIAFFWKRIRKRVFALCVRYFQRIRIDT